MGRGVGGSGLVGLGGRVGGSGLVGLGSSVLVS